MTGFYDRVEGITKGFWEIGKKSGEFFVDIAQEAFTDEDEFEGNGVLDTVWGSWKDNVLGEGGVIQAAFGKDVIDEDGNYSATVGGNLFGSIPESIRQPGNKIISPVLTALDATYEYVIDRPVGTLITLQNMALTDPASVIDPSSYAKAWNITNSRSMGQAFALAVGFVDPTDPDQVAKAKGTPWFNLLSGSIDMMGNLVLDPSNALFAGTKLNKLARNAIRPGDYAAKASLTSSRYLKMKSRIDDLRNDYDFSEQYKMGQGYTQDDLPLIYQLGSKIYKASRTGRLGKDLKMKMTEQFANNLAAVSNPEAFDVLIRMQMGDSSVFEEMKNAAIEVMNEKEVNAELTELTTPLKDSFKVDKEGVALDTRARLTLLKNNPFSGLDPNRAATLRAGEVVETLEQFDPGDVWRIAEEALFNEQSTVQRAVAAERTSNAAAGRLGLWFNVDQAQKIDPLGDGIKNWFKAGDGSVTEAAYIRKAKADLTVEQQEDLLAWAGIHPGDYRGQNNFWDAWDKIIEIDNSVDTGIVARTTAADALQGSVYRGGDSTDKARTQFASYKEQALNDQLERFHKRQDAYLAKWDTEKELYIYDTKIKGFTVRKSRSGKGAKVISGTPLGGSSFTKERKAFWQEWANKNKTRPKIEDDALADVDFRNVDTDDLLDVEGRPVAQGEWEQYKADLSETLPDELTEYIGVSRKDIPQEIQEAIFQNRLANVEEAGFWNAWDELFSEGGGANKQAADKIGKGKQTDLEKKNLTNKTAAERKEDFINDLMSRGASRNVIENAGVPRKDIDIDIQNEIYELFNKENPSSLGTDAMPIKRNVSQGYAPPRKQRVKTFYGTFGKNRLSSDRTPEDGLAPYWENFISVIENNRKNVPREFWDSWSSIRDDEVALKYIRSSTRWKNIPDADKAKIKANNPLEFEATAIDSSASFNPSTAKPMSRVDYMRKYNRAVMKDGGIIDGKRIDSYNNYVKDFNAEINELSSKEFKEYMGSDGLTADFIRAWDGYIGFEKDWQLVRERRFDRDTSSEVSIATDRAILEAEEILLTSIDSRRSSMIASREDKTLVDFEDTRSRQLVDYRANLRSGFTKGKTGTVVKQRNAITADRLSSFFQKTSRMVKRNDAGTITDVYKATSTESINPQELFRSDPKWEADGWEVEEGYNFLPGEVRTYVKDEPDVLMGRRKAGDQDITPSTTWQSRKNSGPTTEQEVLVPGGDGTRPKVTRRKGEELDEDGRPKIELVDDAFEIFLAEKPFQDMEAARQFLDYAPGTFIPIEDVNRLEDNLIGYTTEAPVLSDAFIDAKFKDGTPIDFMTDEQLALSQQSLEQKIMGGTSKATGKANSQLPFAAAFASERLRLKSLARRADFREDAHEGINVLNDALNVNPDLVAAAADDILSTYGVGILDSVPKISYASDVGFKVVEYMEKGIGQGPFGIGGLPATTVRLFSEKVVQGIIYWDDAAHAYGQFDKMLRDAGRVQNNGTSLLDQAGLNADELLGRWAASPGTNYKKPLFYETVDKLNRSLVELFKDDIVMNAKTGQDIDGITRILRRQWKGADQALKDAAYVQKKNYRNGQFRIALAEDNAINVRDLGGVTPQQLAGADLVPRYDLYQNLFKSKGPVSEAAKSLRNSLGISVQAFTTVWKKAVLLRPAWPLRVLSDELLRTAAEIGTVNALKGAMAGFGDLRAGWYQRNGVDLAVPIQDAIIADFKLRTKKDSVKPEGFSKPLAFEDLPYGNLLQEYIAEVAKNPMLRGKKVDPHNVVQDLIKNVIQDDYRKSGITNLGRSGARTMGASAIGAFVAGPAGLAAGAVYGLYSRGSLRRLAEKETVNHVARQLSGVNNARINTRINQIEKRIKEKDLKFSNSGGEELSALVKEATDLKAAKDMLETQANYVLDQHKLIHRISGKKKAAENARAVDIDSAKTDMDKYQNSGTLSQNFDTVGKILHDAGVSDYHLDTYRLGNQFGNTAQEVGIYRNAVSANTYASSLWNSESAAQRATVRSLERQQFDYDAGPERFAAAWDDTVNRQWAPMGDGESMNVFQDFTRKFWQDDVTDQDIISWLATGEGRVLEDAMPSHFNSDDFRVEDWVAVVRSETNSILPNIPEFKNLRARLARGEEIKWNRDVQPIINRKFGGDVQTIRRMPEDTLESFGKIVGDSSFEDAYKTKTLTQRVKNRIDEMFTAIGTMPTDTLTRSVVFGTIYKEEMARRMQGYKFTNKETGETYRFNQKQLNAIEGESRRYALDRTKNLLYDLSERTRFEEIMSNVMPFFAAYQEVMTRWAGLSVRNPAFVLRASRNFNLFLQNFDAEDENGNQVFVVRLGELFEGLEAKVPEGIPVFGGENLFGKTAVLGEYALDFNFKSASMVSMGKPGFGPAFTIPVNETVLKTPNAAEIKETLFGKHSPEGDSAGARIIDSVFPTAGSTLISTLFNTREKQRTKSMVMADLQAEYTLNGQVIETVSDWNDFEDEVDDRTQALLNIRMIANLGLPIPYVAKSAHYEIITEYQTIMRATPDKYDSGKPTGSEAADAWLLTNHPELWAVLGRQTRVATVASGTIEGNEMYEKNKEFILDNKAIGSFLTGGLGSSLDVQFEFNAATFRKELATGQREYQTVEEKYKRASATAGWFLVNEMMSGVYAQQDYLRLNNLPSDLNAASNANLLAQKQAIHDYAVKKYPSFQEALDDYNSTTEKAEVIHAMQRYVDSDIQRGRPELPHMAAYLEQRTKIIKTMAERARMSGNLDMQYLSHPRNSDLKLLWEWERIRLSQVSDFTDFFMRFLENDDAISKDSWPKTGLVTT